MRQGARLRAWTGFYISQHLTMQYAPVEVSKVFLSKIRNLLRRRSHSNKDGPVSEKRNYVHPPREIYGFDIYLGAYRRLVNQLPRPTDEQVNQFVEYVSNAHSWYKKLPYLTKGVPFCFYLDPYAGHDIIHYEDHRVKAVKREEHGFHYSWMATSEYLSRFGYLQYASAYSTGMGDRDRWQGTQTVPMIVGSDNFWYRLPPQVVTAGTALLTGVIHQESSGSWLLLLRERMSAQEEQYWPEESGGKEVLEQLLRLCKEYRESNRGASQSSLENKLAGTELSLNDFESSVEKILAIERNRLKNEMRKSIIRAIDLAYSA
jgi:hypothetical protein